MSNELLYRLQTALNKVYGNTLCIELPSEDAYFCPACCEHVSEEEFNHKHDVCFSCFYEDSSSEVENV